MDGDDKERVGSEIRPSGGRTALACWEGLASEGELSVTVATDCDDGENIE